jgi:hypothetical protein
MEPDLTGDRVTGVMRRDPEHPMFRLAMVLLLDAVECFQQNWDGQDRRSQRAFREVEKWIADDDAGAPLSFEEVCDLLGLDAGYVRILFRRWKERHLLRAKEGRRRKARPLRRKGRPRMRHLA